MARSQYSLLWKSLFTWRREAAWGWFILHSKAPLNLLIVEKVRDGLKWEDVVSLGETDVGCVIEVN